MQAPIIKTGILSSRMWKQLYPSAKRIHCFSRYRITTPMYPTPARFCDCGCCFSCYFSGIWIPNYTTEQSPFLFAQLELDAETRIKNNTRDEEGIESRRDSTTTAVYAMNNTQSTIHSVQALFKLDTPQMCGCWGSYSVTNFGSVRQAARHSMK